MEKDKEMRVCDGASSIVVWKTGGLKSFCSGLCTDYAIIRVKARQLDLQQTGRLYIWTQACNILVSIRSSTQTTTHLSTAIMAQITLCYRPGSAKLVPYALISHLNLPFFHQQFGNIQTDLMGIICREPPDLVYGIQTLEKMPAILTYIAVRTNMAQQLLGSTAEEKIMVINWLSLLEGMLYGVAFKMMAVPPYFTTGGPAKVCDAIWTRGEFFALDVFAKINTRLTGRAWAIGDHYTVVDFNLFVFSRWFDDLYGVGQL